MRLLATVSLAMLIQMPLAGSAEQLATTLLSERATQQQVMGVPAGLIFENLDNPYLMWVELDAGQLHLLERLDQGGYATRASRPISIGKNGAGKEREGDMKTPVGVYQITSFLEDKKLDDFYGVGAYPVNFPNIWDRLQKRTGHGIWLHGMPKGVSSRPRLDSEGCVVLDNDSMLQMDDYVVTGESLVVLAPSLEWLPSAKEQPAADVMDAIGQWHTDWESVDTESYLASYHPEFSDTRKDLAAWSAHKRRVNAQKSYIKVDISKMSVIDYPGEDNLVAVRFYQEYQSSNYNWEGWKHLLWRRDQSGRWLIIYEGNG